MRKLCLMRKTLIMTAMAAMACLTACAGSRGKQGVAEIPAAADYEQTETQAEQEAKPEQAESEQVESKPGMPEQELMFDMPEPEQVSFETDDYDNWNKLLSENDISAEFRRSLEQFAYESGSKVLGAVEGNGNYSPLSLYYALALAGCGAEGETESQIMKSLGMENRQELAQQCRRLYQWYTYREQWDVQTYEKYGSGDYHSKIRLGNSLWVSDGLDINKEYQAMAAQNFFAPSVNINFSDPAAGESIGKWIAEKTEGVLEPEISLDPETMLTIINTLYFYGSWTEPFDESQTADDIFRTDSGEEIACQFLNRTEAAGQFTTGDGYRAACLNTNNHCQMVFFLPDEDRQVNEFLESPEAFRQVVDVDNESWTSGRVIWKIPKFSFGSSFEMEKMLAEMGMERMLSDQAEFGKISDKPLQVSQVLQETHIGIDEQGVEGAAYTMLAMEGAGMEEPELSMEMILDRPFLFGIRDAYHDVWLFMGVCRNPGV